MARGGKNAPPSPLPLDAPRTRGTVAGKGRNALGFGRLEGRLVVDGSRLAHRPALRS